ncbi:hypothetical protein BJY00DRAFT_270982 [Aspergillus carlsbadensis]|nr:hypothetical protein BJY00DRAFT_270982 [Aspergillus carlsbadensis]
MDFQAEMSPVEGSGPGCSHEIAWPTIFFWMACLALNSIAQPSGRVLGTKYRHQAILRSSPIICGFDAIDILISWPAQALPGLDFRQAASRILWQRFVDSEGNPDVQAIARAKTQAGGRWLAFFIGVVPQLIKLYVSKGIPWSQAAATMYLASWLLFELLLLAAQSPNTPVKLADAQPQAYRHEKHIRATWAFTAMVAHAIVYTIPVQAQMDVLSNPSEFGSYSMTGIPLSMYTFRLWWGAFFGADATPSRNRFFYLLIGAAFHTSLWHFPDEAKLLHTISVIVVSFGAALAFYWLGYRWAMAFLVSFQVLNVLSQPLLLYLFLYDSAGTYQPDWLRWLG